MKLQAHITTEKFKLVQHISYSFFTTSLNVFYASSSVSVIVSVKLSSIISLRICGPSNIPSLILACDSEENFMLKYWKHGLFLTPSQTLSSFPVWCAMVEVEFFHCQQDLHSRHFWILVAVAPFRANVQYPTVCPWPCYPTRIGNRDILCSLFVVPAAIQWPSNHRIFATHARGI